MNIDFSEYFYYDETSPSCLRWKVDVLSGKNYSSARIKKGDVAGSLNKKGYYHVMCNWKDYRCHRIVYEIMFDVKLDNYGHIDHINGISSDNSKGNLRIVDTKGNAQNRKKQHNNSTGKTGASFTTNGKGRTYATTSWREDGKARCRTFSVLKYGLLPAFSMAVNYRKVMIETLNIRGAGYTERHGS